VLALAALGLGLAACGVFREPLATPAPTAVVQISADEAAQAMADDHFWASYSHSTLLIQGTVAAIDSQPQHFILSLATSGSGDVQCDLGSPAQPPTLGDRITVRSANPQNDVVRQGDGLLIRNCTLP
jgi:hypothetical protein